MVSRPAPSVRVVGRRATKRAFSGKADTKAAAVAWRRAFPTPFVPRGVYRFTSHEEADEWLWNVGQSAEECAAIDFECPEATHHFTNVCGCGCEQSPSCQEVFDCQEIVRCDFVAIRQACPYSRVSL